MMSKSRSFGLALFCSLVAGLLLHPAVCWADEPDDAPPWCTHAKTKVENLICEKLGPYDEELNVYYRTLLKMVEPSAKSDLIRSQKRWIVEREQCGAIEKTPEGLVDCVGTKIRQRSRLLQKDIADRNSEKDCLNSTNSS
jgi:uncharacterized protein